jgi:hypothetical protein
MGRKAAVPGRARLLHSLLDLRGCHTGRYDSVLVLRPTINNKALASRPVLGQAQGEAAMDWAIGNTSGQYNPLEQSVLDGSWYSDWAWRNVSSKWAKVLGIDLKNLLGSADAAAVTHIPISKWADRASLVFSSAQYCYNTYRAIQDGIDQAPGIKGNWGNHKNWYGAKAAVHAWDYALGDHYGTKVGSPTYVNYASGSQGHGLTAPLDHGWYILPIDLVSSRQMDRIQAWR